MGAINVWLAHFEMAHDKPGMGGWGDVCYLGDTASLSYYYHIRI